MDCYTIIFFKPYNTTQRLCKAYTPPPLFVLTCVYEKSITETVWQAYIYQKTEQQVPVIRISKDSLAIQKACMKHICPCSNSTQIVLSKYTIEYSYSFVNEKFTDAKIYKQYQYIIFKIVPIIF